MAFDATVKRRRMFHLRFQSLHRFFGELRTSLLSGEKAPGFDPGKAHRPIGEGPFWIVGIKLSPERHRGFLHDFPGIGAVGYEDENGAQHHRLAFEE